MIGSGDRVLVAVSGGADSVALLAALAMLAEKLRIELCAAHLNHGLRGAEALRDQDCAQAVAAQLGVRCVVGEASQLLGAGNLEARARRVRYEFLARVAGEECCTRIATGHTMDDQAETVLMRLLRGTGGDGLAGIRPVAGRIVRPMLGCTRAQVVAFLRAHGLPHCEDSSNADHRFLRNRIRHEVLPLLQAINPRVVRSLASTATAVTSEATWLDDQVQALLSGASSGDGVLAAAVAEAPTALRPRLVRSWLRAQRGDLRGLTAAHVRAVVDLALGQRPNARVRLPGAQVVVRAYERLRWLAQEDDSAGDEAERVLLPGAVVTWGSTWRISAQVVPGSGVAGAGYVHPWDLAADADVVASPLIIRHPRPGDRIRPFGMQGHRKLQDIFVDRRIPRAARWSHSLVEAGGEVLWVPGVVRSNRAPITPVTRSRLQVSARKMGIAAP